MYVLHADVREHGDQNARASLQLALVGVMARTEHGLYPVSRTLLILGWFPIRTHNQARHETMEVGARSSK